MGFSGPKFTRSRGQNLETRKNARLDRALCNIEWRLRFQDGGVRHLIRHQSDYAPILISTTGFSSPVASRKRFKFQAAWLLHKGFEEFISRMWMASTPVNVTLKALTERLDIWNKETFGNLFRRKRNIWRRIVGIQENIAAGGPRYLLKLELKLRNRLDEVLSQIELFWYQKSRAEYIKDGDRNTCFFHLSTIIRRKINRIET